MTAQEHFLSQRQRYQPISLPQHFSDEEMARDWTLLERDRHEIERYRKDFRLYMAIQICAVRLYGRFLPHVHDLSPHIELVASFGNLSKALKEWKKNQKTRDQGLHRAPTSKRRDPPHHGVL